MTSHSIEVHAAGTAPQRAGLAFAWPRTDTVPSNVASTLNWDLSDFSAAPAEARDLFRIAAAAYLADTAVSKPEVSLHRNIDLLVHVEDPSRWHGEPLSEFADLLHWLTGDAWTLNLARATAQLPLAVAPPAARIQLLSGGLDSLCGAVIGLRDAGGGTRFIGHRDASNAVRHAQNVIAEAIHGHPYDRYEFFIRDAALRKNHGPRSRSLMFMALGVVAAASSSAHELWVPENGFTSINPPLDAGRGGTLTTRSTHPYTFKLVSGLLAKLQIDVIVRNPFSGLTKGELVAAAMPDLMNENYASATTASFSCAKGGSQFHGGDSNHNCGLCVACVVRRGAFLGANVSDPTPYDCEILTGDGLAGLVRQRWRDIVSLGDAAVHGIPEDLVLTSGRWPAGTDFDSVLSIVTRGLGEVRRVALPAA